MFISLPVGTMSPAPSDSPLSVSVAFAGVVMAVVIVVLFGLGGVVSRMLVVIVSVVTVGGLVSDGGLLGVTEGQTVSSCNNLHTHAPSIAKQSNLSIT